MTTKTEKKVFKQMLNVKVKKDSVELSWQETTLIETIDAETNATIGTDKFVTFHDVKSKFLPHVDFLNAMKMLRKPAIDITETGNYKNFDDYTIKGIALIGMDNDEDPRVVITVSKKLEHNPKPWNFNTPACTLTNTEKYSGAEKLDEFCKAICDEAWLYLEGKHAANPQMKLEFDSPAEAPSAEVKEESHAEDSEADTKVVSINQPKDEVSIDDIFKEAAEG